MSTLEDRILLLSEQVGVVATERHHIIVTAESCTGGGIAAALTAVPGSSAWFEEGFITYAAEKKTERLGVPATLIEKVGVVSEAVAQAMARGALAKSPTATLSVAVTGIAGPSGGSARQPVGTVCLAWGERYNGHIVTCSRTIVVPGSRATVRAETVRIALTGLIEKIGYGNPSVMPCEY
ncbi:CinA domain-containing protein [gut metagenome]|uniref:CinA domain-containing protein n=1 Tax=gut metagenome TaxID=749906 RepID=J9GQ87_9ZZZZ